MNKITGLALLTLAFVLPRGFATAETLPATSADGSRLETDTRAGHFTALHFFADAQTASSHADTLESVADGIAGVKHAVIVAEAASDKNLYRDNDGLTATKYNVSGETPTVVLIDASGKEVFRRSTGGGVPFEAIAAQLRALTRNRALSDYNLKKDRVAIEGYDPVSYFANNEARKGNPAIRSEYRGVVYYFASAENRALFADSPKKYLPTYGGWCATAMATGDKVGIDPENFKVTDGRLFLFYKGIWGNAIKDWNKEEAKLTVEADAEWKDISGE